MDNTLSLDDLTAHEIVGESGTPGKAGCRMQVAIVATATLVLAGVMAAGLALVLS